MYPILAQVGLITIYTYGVLVTVGRDTRLVVCADPGEPCRVSSPRDLEPRDLHDFRCADRVEALARGGGLELLLGESGPNFQRDNVRVCGNILWRAVRRHSHHRFVYADAAITAAAGAGYFGGGVTVESCDRPTGMLRRGVLLRQAHDGAMGRDISGSYRRGVGWHSARYAITSDPVVRGGCRVSEFSAADVACFRQASGERRARFWEHTSCCMASNGESSNFSAAIRDVR